MIHEVQTDSAYALLIRHARRYPIEPGDLVWEARLTAGGRSDAEDFGKTLIGFQFGGAFASPVPRCVETAELICRGWGHGEAVTPESLLLDAYVMDKVEVKAQFQVADSDQLILDHIAGVVLKGFKSVESGSTHLLREICARMDPRPGALTLFVTHDALLMPFRAHFRGESFSRNTWLPFLDGAVIRVHEGDVFIDERAVLLETPGAVTEVADPERRIPHR